MAKRMLLLAIVALLASSVAFADNLAAGATIGPPVPNNGGVFGPDTVAASTGWINFSTVNSSGQVKEVVGLNVNTGTYDFFYQFKDVTGPIEHLTAYNFAGVTTDVYAFSDCNGCTSVAGFEVGTYDANTVNRTSDGSTVSFNFSPAASGGQISYIMMISTNSTVFHTGSIGLIDGSGTSALGYSPVPEPASLTLMASGLALFGMKFKRS